MRYQVLFYKDTEAFKNDKWDNLFNVNFDSHKVLEAKLTLKDNDIDDFVVKLPETNKQYSKIEPMKAHIKIIEWADGEDDPSKYKTIFVGRALKPTKSMDENGLFAQEYTFESIEAYLLDSMQRFIEVANVSVKDLLNMLINEHNNQLPDYKQFIVRNVDVTGTVTGTDGQDKVYIEYEKTRDVMKKLLRDVFGGYFRVERKNGKNYLDYLKDPGVKHDNGTPIQLGVNVKSASVVIDPTQAITVLVPLGAEEESEASSAEDDGAGGKSEEVIAYAKKFLGKPYILGGPRGVDLGDDLSSFGGTDCSGLTSNIYKHFGITIGTYTVAQESDVTPISRSQVQTGDLGFVGPKGGTTHVVMALDNKTLIQESSPSEPCNIKSIDGYYSTLWWGRNEQMAQLVAETATPRTSGNGITTAQNGDWGPAIRNAAYMMDAQITDDYVNRVKSLIQHESGGSETVQNNWDVNAQRGTPSIGLIQYIQPTFDSYKVDGYGDIRKGFHQLLALFNDSNYLTDVRLGGWGPTGSKRMNKPANSGSKNSGGSWAWPFPSAGEGSFAGGQLFGVHPGGEFRQNGFHDGLDFGSVDHPGREVHAIHGGTVTRKGYMGGLENYFVTHSSDGYNVVYQEAFASQADIKVNVGDKVKTGDVVGYRNTSHLHIGITKTDFMLAVSKSFINDGTWLDPQNIIKNGTSDGSDDDDSDGENGGAKKDSGPRPRITIASVNDGEDYIEITNLMNELTPIVGKQVWDDITDPQALKSKAEEWIRTQQAISTAWEVSALELPKFADFIVHDSYKFKVPQIATEQLLRITQKEIDLLRPYQSSITIADKSISLSNYQAELRNKVNKIDSIESQVRSQASQISSIQNGADNAQIRQISNALGSVDLAQLKKDYDGTKNEVDKVNDKMTDLDELINQLKERLDHLEEGGEESGV